MADSSMTRSPAHNSTVNGGSDTTNAGYIAFVVVPVFFLLGLLGVLICHILKRKGYRCTTDAEDDEDLEGEEEKHLDEGELNDTYEGNTDTVGQIVHYIMKNEANTDALKAMVTENSIDSDGGPVTPTSPTLPPLTPVSPGAPPSAAKHTCNHLHTIGGLGGQKNICNRCSQKKWPLMRRGSNKKMDRRSHIGEVTVLSVGRFRVTRSDPRQHPVRRTLMITEPNGSVPASPARSEADPLSNSVSSQPQTESDDKK